MRVRFLLTTILLCVATSHVLTAWAQDNFKPGYIVRLNGDTVRGLVQLRGALRNSTECRFRTTASATTYQPTELRAYGVDNTDYYEAHQLPKSRESKMAPAPVLFLSLLAKGKARLYSRRDDNDQTHFYLALNGDSLQELRQIRVQRMVNGSLYNETQYPFRKILSQAFSDCLAVQPLLPTLQLTSGQLSKVVERYNECVGGTITTKLHIARERQKVSFGLVGGVQYSKVSFSSNVPEHNGTYTEVGKPVVGLFITVTTPALNRHLAFRLDALYEQLHYKSSYVANNISTVPVSQQTNFNLKYLCLPLQVRYSFSSGLVRPYVLVGGSLNYLLSYDTHLHSEYLAGNSIVAYDGPATVNDFITRTDFGLLGGVGLATSALAGHTTSLEVRAETSSGFVTGNLPSPITRVRALLSIALTK